MIFTFMQTKTNPSQIYKYKSQFIRPNAQPDQPTLRAISQAKQVKLPNRTPNFLCCF